ncbi:MAG: SRPBCC family protein [Ferruginibacter sp.]
MNILLIILTVIVSLILLFLLIAVYTSKDYAIVRTIRINAPKQKVFDYIKMLKNQDYYSKWVMTDPAMKKEFTGTDGTVGFIYGWSGNKKAGEGEQEIKTITEGSSMVSEVRFVRPFAGLSNLELTATSVGDNETEVSWSVRSIMKFPMNGMIPFIKNMLAKDMDTSLVTLKSILEK